MSFGAVLCRLEGPSGVIRSESLAPYGMKEVSGSEDKSVRIWDASFGALLSSFEGHSDGVTSV